MHVVFVMYRAFVMRGVFQGGRSCERDGTRHFEEMVSQEVSG